MNQEARKELIKGYSATIYTHIRLAGLHKALETEEWDRELPEAWANAIFEKVETFINDKFTEIEARNSATD